MEKLPGMLALILLLLTAIIYRESAVQGLPDHYMFPVSDKGGISYTYTETSDLNYLPDNTNTFVVWGVSEMDYFGLQLCSKTDGMKQVTVVSDVNFCKVGKNTDAIFYDNGFIHVLTPTNDTLVYTKNQINWLPEKIKIVGDSVVLSNDTARVTVPVYRN